MEKTSLSKTDFDLRLYINCHTLLKCEQGCCYPAGGSNYDWNKDVRLSFDIKNIFNEEYYDSAFNRYVYLGQPRTAKFGVSYSF